MIYQRDRQYSLIIGKGNKGVEINGLNISFSVTKSSDNKKTPNRARLEIYNLSQEYQSYFEEAFIQVALHVGYADVGKYLLFAGEATIVGTRKSGADSITTIQLDVLYEQMNHKIISKTTPPGTTVKSVIEAVVKETEGVTKVVFSGTNITRSFVDGYPMTATPRQIMDDLSSAFELEWQIDNGVMYVEDRGTSYMKSTKEAFVISEDTGMIEQPYYDNIEKQRGRKDKIKKARKGVKVKTLLNPTFIAGSIVKIEHGEFTGFYKVERVQHSGQMFGSEWTSELVLGTVLAKE